MARPPGPHGPADFDLIRIVAEATADPTDPVPLLQLASTLVAAIVGSDGEDTGTDLDFREANRINRAIPDVGDLSRLQDIALSMLDPAGQETESLVRIWAEMIDDELFRRRIRRQLPPADRREPEWVRRIDEVTPRRAAAIVSPVLIEETIVVEISTAARSCTLAIGIERSGAPFIEDAYLTPESFDTVMSGIAVNPEIDVDRVELSPADARARIIEALDMSDTIIPAPATETWPGTRAMLTWMLRLMPTGGIGYDLKEWTPEEIKEIADDFAASPWAADLTGDELRHADLLLEFQANYGNNDPLRWSGSFTDRILHDLYPRKVVADDAYMLSMPTTLTALVQYASERSGVDPGFTQNALNAIEAGRADYVSLVTGRAEPDTIGFPFAELPDGVDLPPELIDALQARFVADEQFATRQLALLEETVGGRANLDSLTIDPLPTEDFDATGIPDDVVDRLRPLLPQVTTTAQEFFGDPEFATVAFRILAEVARREPTVFRRRFSDPALLAALFWIAGEINETFFASTAGRTPLRIKDLQSHLGAKSAPSQRADTLLAALGHPRGPGSRVHIPDPRLLTSTFRAELLERRAWYQSEY